MNRSLFTVATFVRINTRRFFRDKTALFFTIGFPLIFLFVFGGLNSNSNNVSLHVAVINHSESKLAKEFISSGNKSKVLNIDKHTKNLDEAKEKMTRAQLDAVIILPKSFGEVQPGQNFPSGKAEVQYTQNNQQSAQALVSILETQFKAINTQFVKSETPFSVSAKQLNQKTLSSFDYAFTGMLGFAIIGMGIFGPINVFPELKKMGILRRLRTTPLKVWQYFLSTMVGQAIIGLIALAIMFVAAIGIFHLKVIGNPIEIAMFLIFGIVLILGIGLALGGWAKNERQVAPLANIIVFPMMFLSGTFFPRFLMPEWLQNISAFIPLTPVIDGSRLLITEGKHFIDIVPQLGLMGMWLIVIYAIAFKVFRWE